MNPMPIRVKLRTMEFKLLEKKKDSIKVEIVDPDETLIYPLIHELLVTARAIFNNHLVDTQAMLSALRQERERES